METLSRKKFRNVFISSTGGLLEMYDFTIYAFFAPIISQLFFPHEAGSFAAVLSTFAIFASGYLARPLGAAFFGQLGDRRGRKATLLWTIIIMALSTTFIGLLPTWQSIGILAPILLFLLRLFQGFAVGGDLPGAITFVAEHAKPNERGMDCAWVFFAVNLGLLLAMAASGVITVFLPKASVMNWGWRVAFLSGLVIGFVGLYLRFHVAESKSFSNLLEKNAISNTPLQEILSRQAFPFLQAIFIMVICAIVIGQFLYLPTYFHFTLGMTFKQAIFMNAALTLLFSLMIPLFGYFADRYGRRSILFFSTAGFIVFSMPIYYWLQMQSTYWFDFSVVLLAIFSAACISVFPSMLAELFPTRVRYSGLALGYNVSFALFCGTTPMIMATLQHVLSNPLAPSLYLMLGAAVSCIATVFTRETRGLSLA